MIECPKCKGEMKFKLYSLTATQGLKKIYVCKNKGCKHKMTIPSKAKEEIK